MRDEGQHERFLGLTQLPPKSKLDEECWHWLGSERGGRSKKSGRYGQFWYNGKTGYAHRYSYEWYHGEIPDNYEVDHVCRNRKCVNPAHLRIIPRRSNRRRTSQRKQVKW
jgi:hypothetical protein